MVIPIDSVILAAGYGRRLNGKIKCLLKVKGLTLLERQITSLFRANSVTVVTGYKHYEIEHFIAINDLPAFTLFNPVSAFTENIVSLYTYFKFFEPKNPLIIMSADVVLAQSVYSRLFTTKGNLLVFGDRFTGVSKVEDVSLLNDILIEMVEKKRMINAWQLDALLRVTIMDVLKVKDEEWSEIDTPDDLIKAGDKGL